MEIVFYDENNGSTTGTNENGSLLMPVSPDDSGEGLPYAPVNWPNRGDTWTWRVGKRIASTGHYLDRYLYLPKRLCRRIESSSNSSRRKHGFASKLSLERYIRAAFPGADVEAFFNSFSWKIPAKKSALTNGHVERRNLLTIPLEEMAEYGVSDSPTDTGGCKAGNKMCSSILEQSEKPPLAAMPCDICCSEPRFCHDCCCILCSKLINSEHGGYSHIKCEAVVNEGYICGHIAHIDCALRCYMAGTVGGSIGLDAEYYCRRCDARTDLVSHAARFLQTCESIDSRDDIEKILSVGVCILGGSQKTSAKRLLIRFESAIAKLQSGTSLEDIWKVEDSFSAISTGAFDHGNAALEVMNDEDPLNVRTSSGHTLSIAFDHQSESLRLEDEIEQVLQALRKSQDSEFKMAEERLHVQKNFLLNLYQQLEKERSELARCASSADPNALLDAVLNRVDQIKRELRKLKDMERVANGFGKTSKGILKEHFGLETQN
ncbi:protein OBERON 2-like [Quercus lobata]|uniref:protein OBERON 2-like n=1 Tax=Quercus lobata TaxID=97700 RepID=UPI0012469333|nr:protein OBERON 2-like [Quercus lobata]XP_030974276.1 protein OBERON 2-like [Quercus lobata]